MDRDRDRNDGGPSLAVRLMQVAGEYELERKREKQRMETRVQRLEELNSDLTQTNDSQQAELETQARQVAKLSADLEKISVMQTERVKDVEQLLVVARWQLAERTQQLYALHRALKSLQSPPAPRKLPGAAAAAAASENHDPSADEDDEGGALVAAGSAALCASLRSSTGLDLDESLRELEAAAAAVRPYSVEAALEAAEKGDARAFDRILQPAAAPHPAATAAAAAHGFDIVLGQALCRAAAGGHLAIATRCVALGASAAVRSSADSLGMSALLAAAAAGHEAVVKLLLGKAAGGGSGVDDTDAYKRTPLHLAAAGNHGAVAKLLLFNGAAPGAVDCNGLTPADIAEGTEHLLSAQVPPAGSGPGGAASARGSGDKRPGAHYRTGELPVNRRAPAVLKVLSDANVRFWNASVRANRAYQEKQFSRAIAAYSDALALATGSGGANGAAHAMAASPRDLATLHYNRARARYRLGAHCAAIEDCSTALEHDPSYRNALAQRAECYMSVFDHKRAAQDFQSLLDGDANDTQWARRLVEARSMRDLSHYGVLGVRRDADAALLKRAYRALCLRWHPDKHATSPEDRLRANTAFGRISDAYEVLSDQFKRMLYDMEPASHKGTPVATDPAHLGGGGSSSARGSAAAAVATAAGSGSGGALMSEGFDRWYAREAERDRDYEREWAAQVAAEAEADRKLEDARSALRLERLRAVTAASVQQATVDAAATGRRSGAAAEKPDAAPAAPPGSAKAQLRGDPLSQRLRGMASGAASAASVPVGLGPQSTPAVVAAAASASAAPPASASAPSLRPSRVPLVPVAPSQQQQQSVPLTSGSTPIIGSPAPPAVPQGGNSGAGTGQRGLRAAAAAAAASSSVSQSARQPPSPGRRPLQPAPAAGLDGTPDPAAAAAAAAGRAQAAMDAAESLLRQMQAMQDPAGGGMGMGVGSAAPPPKAGLRAQVESRVRMSGGGGAAAAAGGAVPFSTPLFSGGGLRPRGGDAGEQQHTAPLPPSPRLPGAAFGGGDRGRAAAGSSDDSGEGEDEFGDLVGEGGEEDEDDDEEAYEGGGGGVDAGQDDAPLDSTAASDATDALVSDGEGGVDDSELPPQTHFGTSAADASLGGHYDPLRYGEPQGRGTPRREAIDLVDEEDDEGIDSGAWMRRGAAATAAAAAATAGGHAAAATSSPAFARAFARSFAAGGGVGGGPVPGVADLRGGIDDEISDVDLAASIAQLEKELGAAAEHDQ